MKLSNLFFFMLHCYDGICTVTWGKLLDKGCAMYMAKLLGQSCMVELHRQSGMDKIARLIFKEKVPWIERWNHMTKVMVWTN